MEKNRKETAPERGMAMEKDQEKEIKQKKETTNEEGSQGQEITQEKVLQDQKVSQKQTAHEKEFLASVAAGDTVPYGLANDYMFHAVLQSSAEALQGLLSALLYIPESEILSCEVINPIILGDAITEKTCILDIRVLLNGDRQINIEMQMGDISNWTDRSVFYLCKMFTDLKQGEDYTNIKPSVHIGILNKTPLPADAAFYNEYALLNRKSGYEFTGKFILRVLDLSYLDKVSEEETHTSLYYWASVFKAQTWKELMKLAEQSESIKKAVLKLHELTQKETVRLQCEARERYRMDLQSTIKTIRAEGIAEGREEERKNTEYEKKRADEAEKQVKKLRELLEKNGISLKE